ncbi:hypothetical protein AIOL_004742 [Candidatus Rhodobacter oscarellae]|uniref:SnoaL-like domain-containing protein n=1 Tax=Candidatus Rhodobacter oscarellae TaxID=1675527 RepID=A0A0J9EDF8_9RHOB|nr:hypothetical protein AIOL_004742 [Candidatus Rhodobacter lobularis]
MNRAQEIVEHVLNEAGTALIAGDFSRFVGHFEIPVVVETYENRIVLDTEAALRDMFFSVHKYYRDLGVSQIHRCSISAAFDGADNIHASHINYVLAHGGLAQDAFAVYSQLRRGTAGWQVWCSQYAIPDSDLLNRVLSGDVDSASVVIGRGQEKLNLEEDEGQSAGFQVWRLASIRQSSDESGD